MSFDCNISWNCNKLWVRVKNSVGFISANISVNHNVDSPETIHFRFCQIIYLFFIMLWRIFNWLLSYDLSKILAKLVISLNHHIFFARFLEILLNNNITSSKLIFWNLKNHSELIWFYIFRFSIKDTISPKCF